MTVATKKPAAKAPVGLCNMGMTGQRIQRLSDPELQPQIEMVKANIIANPAEATALLRRMGMLTPKGNLKKAFGG